MTETTTTPKEKAKKPTAPAAVAGAKGELSRKTLKRKFRQKLAAKIKTDKEFSKAYFDARSKRAIDKKAAFKKKKKSKK